MFKFSKISKGFRVHKKCVSDWIISKFTLCVAGPTLENLGMEMDD